MKTNTPETDLIHTHYWNPRFRGHNDKLLSTASEPEDCQPDEGECCDEPRGLVGGVCDFCGGIVKPEKP